MCVCVCVYMLACVCMCVVYVLLCGFLWLALFVIMITGIFCFKLWCINMALVYV